MPVEHYCEEDHWTEKGFWIWPEDAGALIQKYHFDSTF